MLSYFIFLECYLIQENAATKTLISTQNKSRQVLCACKIMRSETNSHILDGKEV